MAPPTPTDAQTLALVQEQIQQLTTAVQALAPRQEGYNPFAEHDENPIVIIEQGSKFEIPEFHGEQSAEELLNWMVTVEETLEFGRVPLNRCVPMIAMRFRGRAAAWWSQLKASRARLGKPRILSWDKLKKKMRKTFLPFNYDQVMFQRFHMLRQGDRSVEEYYIEFFSLLTRVDLQETDQQTVGRFVGGLGQEIRYHLNLLNPLTLAEAHQQALTVEPKKPKKKKGNLLKEIVEPVVVYWVGCMATTLASMGFIIVLGKIAKI